MSKKSVEHANLEELPNPTRRALSLSLGLFPMLPLLGGGMQAARAALAPTALAPASASGVFRHPGLLVTEDDFTRIRAYIQAGQEPWASWWKTLCADRFSTLDAKPFPLPAVYRADNSKNAMYVDIWRAWRLVLRWKLSDPQDNRYADKARLYVDGTEVAKSDSIRLSPRQVGDQVAFLGRGWGLPSFNGRIQDFRVRVGALSAAEIATLAR